MRLQGLGRPRGGVARVLLLVASLAKPEEEKHQPGGGRDERANDGAGNPRFGRGGLGGACAGRWDAGAGWFGAFACVGAGLRGFQRRGRGLGAGRRADGDGGGAGGIGLGDGGCLGGDDLAVDGDLAEVVGAAVDAKPAGRGDVVGGRGENGPGEAVAGCVGAVARSVWLVRVRGCWVLGRVSRGRAHQVDTTPLACVRTPFRHAVYTRHEVVVAQHPPKVDEVYHDAIVWHEMVETDVGLTTKKP